MPRNAPQVAHLEDYDSEAEVVRPGTRRDAKRRSTTVSRPPKAIDKYRSTPRDAASDSGYSSHASGAMASTGTVSAPPERAMPPPPIPPPAPSPTKSKPILHRSESQRSKEKAPTRSNSTSRQRSQTQCVDPACQHPLCISARSLEGQQQQPAAQSYFPQHALHYTTAPQQYHQAIPQYQYQYAQVPQVSTNQTVPMVSAQPRPRQGVASRTARPASIHGYSFPGLYANTSQGGPPPATSAYQNMNMQYAAWAQAHQQQQQAQAAYQYAVGYGSSANPNMTNYPQQSPVTPITPSPTSPTFTTTSSENQPSYSARVTNAPYDSLAQRRPSNSLNRAYSARPPPVRTRAMPGAYPPENADSSDGSSDSESSEYSDEEYERDHRARARDSRLMSSSSDRRPSLRRQSATLPVVPTHRSAAREVVRRNLKTDTSLDYISSSDNMDSDRTARAVVDRPRTTYTSSGRSSRRPSVATTATASSGRTKATTISSTSGLANVTGLRGPRQRDITYYATKDRDAIEYIRQRMDGQRLEDAASAYQKEVGGSQSPELTRDNIREHRRSDSHYSSHSRSRVSRSSSRKPDATRIESGGTVIHVYPGSTVEMRPGKDGASTLVIGTASGKDKTYYAGSRSSRRTSRTYVGSDTGSKYEGTVQDAEVTGQRTN